MQALVYAPSKAAALCLHLAVLTADDVAALTHSSVRVILSESVLAGKICTSPTNCPLGYTSV